MITDNSPMPFGKHKGEKMANVPDTYLAWLLGQGFVEGDLKKYLEDNREAIISNAAGAPSKKNNAGGTR